MAVLNALNLQSCTNLTMNSGLSNLQRRRHNFLPACYVPGGCAKFPAMCLPKWFLGNGLLKFVQSSICTGSMKFSKHAYTSGLHWFPYGPKEIQIYLRISKLKIIPSNIECPDVIDCLSPAGTEARVENKDFTCKPLSVVKGSQLMCTDLFLKSAFILIVQMPPCT